MQSQRLPTLEDVARVAGVSRATVSRVINGIRNVDQRLHDQVWTAVTETGYVPNRLARSLVTRRTGTITLVVSDTTFDDTPPFRPHPSAMPHSSATPHPAAAPRSSAAPHSSATPHPAAAPRSSATPHPATAPHSSATPRPSVAPHPSIRSHPSNRSNPPARPLPDTDPVAGSHDTFPGIGAAAGGLAGATAPAGSGGSSSRRGGEGSFMGRFFSDPYFGRVVGGLMSVLRPAGMQLALQMVDAAGHQRLIGDLRNGHTDGAVVLSLPARDPLPALMAEARVPAVLIGRPAEPIPISYVDLDNEAGAALAADHLAARGCRRPGILSGPPDVPASVDRVSGFRRAMARHGHAWVPLAAGNFTRDSGEQAMRDLLAASPGLDAVFVANDLMALGALAALREAGLRVPEDVAVAGFDDSSAALAAHPALTTVRLPLEDMAAEAAHMLMSRVDDPNPHVTSVIYEPTLIRRESA